MAAERGDGVGEALEELRRALARLELALERLREEAIRDPLTGAFNRRFLETRLAEEVARAERYGVPFSLLLLDLDDFKRFNDRHGHLAGDRLLAELALLWRSALRQADELFRFGGDEFVVLLPQTPRGAALETGRRLEALTLEGGSRASLSVGVAGWPEDGRTPEALLAAADRSLYETKKPGGAPAAAAAARPDGGAQPEALGLALGYAGDPGAPTCIWIDGRAVRVLAVKPVEGQPESLALLTEEGRWTLPRRALRLPPRA
ncbi:MAG: GGDEF domain-containing protein [Clostridia bacterium]|nr:GGDEF domain-containing protein [Clostridia bacterium]